MNPADFETVLNCRLSRIRKVLGRKAGEYAKGNDRLHNFRRAGRMLGCTPEAALLGMLAKHLISIMDMVDDLDQTSVPASYQQWDEKLGDAINYLILLEGCIADRINEGFDRRVQNELHRGAERPISNLERICKGQEAVE